MKFKNKDETKSTRFQCTSANRKKERKEKRRAKKSKKGFKNEIVDSSLKLQSKIKNSKSVKPLKDKKIGSFNSIEEEPTKSSFKIGMSSNAEERFAKLQAFVDKESSSMKISQNNKKETLAKKSKSITPSGIEDKEINRLSRLLGIKSRAKRKKVHPMFDEFDMPFLLQDVDEHNMENKDFYCEGGDIDDLNSDIPNPFVEKANLQFKRDLSESDSDDSVKKVSKEKKIKFSRTVEIKEFKSKNKPKDCSENKVIYEEDQTSSCEDYESDSDIDENDDKQFEDMNDEFSEVDEDMEVEDEKNNPNIVPKEDIYGRVKGIESDTIKSDAKYVPPALRKLMQLDSNDKLKKEKLINIRKKLNGLINRLALENMAGIGSEIETLYRANSHNDMNTILTDLYMNSIVSVTITPERLVQEHAFLIGILSANVGVEVGAHILGKFIEHWNELLKPKTEQEDKRIDNVLLFVANLYNFRVVTSTLLYDLLHKHIELFSEKDVDAILHILRSVGFTLRKDNPHALKTVINNIQSKAASISNSDSTYTRITFLTEILLAIRNNNMNKVPDYDPTHVEYLKKILKGIIHKERKLPELEISLKDLLDSAKSGRWWLVGSAWSGGLIEEKSIEEETVTKSSLPPDGEYNYSKKFKLYAAKLRLQRPPRINILYVMTEGSTNVDDAFEKLLHLGLSVQHEKEMFDILSLCCIKSKIYNPFYAHLGEKFCLFHKKYQRSMLHSLWQQFSMLNTFKEMGRSNLSKFVCHLILEECINLSVFKTMNFLNSDKVVIQFVKDVLITILLHPAGETTVRNIFMQLSSSPKLKLLQQTIRIFIIKFITVENTECENYSVLSKRIKIANHCLEGTTIEL